MRSAGVAVEAGVAYINPDSVEAELHRGEDVELKVVADRPGIFGSSTERGEECLEDAPVGLSGAELAFDDDVVEVGGETEALDLGALGVRRPVRHHAQPHALSAETVERIRRAGEQRRPLLSQVTVRLGDLVGEVRVVAAQLREDLFEDSARVAAQVETASAVALRVGPEPRALLVDRGAKAGYVNAGKPRFGDRTGVRPAAAGIARVVEERIVEVDEERAGERGHVSILAEARAEAQQYTGSVARVTITASFPDAGSARAAARGLAAEGVAASIEGQREGGFMARFALIVAAWSIAGTAVGAVFGAVLSYTVGPHGTEGLILLVVTWALFAHLLIGLWAGYILLADRSSAEITPGGPTTLRLQADRSAAPGIAERLRADGATDVSARGETKIELAAGQ